ncbi:hypothetical protein Q8F55_006482 [Vanrija albida]|uniref:ERCC4 domain-containing protein n=1 Tax=Vanrija albida TaxID=181172 RepID=A0ABR3PX97_9TREE
MSQHQEIIVLSDASDSDDGIAIVGSTRVTRLRSSSPFFLRQRSARAEIHVISSSDGPNPSSDASFDIQAILRGITSDDIDDHGAPPWRSAGGSQPSPLRASPSRYLDSRPPGAYRTGRTDSLFADSAVAGPSRRARQDRRDEEPRLKKKRPALESVDGFSNLRSRSPSAREPSRTPTPTKTKKRKAPARASPQRSAAHLDELDAGESPRAKKKWEREAAKEAAKVERARARDEAKAAKEAEKSYQKKLNDVNKLRISKTDALRDIEVHLAHDLSLPSAPIAGALPEIEARLAASNSAIHTLSQTETVVGATIRFLRHVRAEWDKDTKRYIPLDQERTEWDPTVVLVCSADDVVDFVAEGDNALIEWLADLRLTLRLKKEDQVILLVRGLDKYHAKTKSLAERAFRDAARAGLSGDQSGPSSILATHGRVDKSVVEAELLRAQLEEMVFVVQVEKTEEIEDWVFNLACDVAVRPFKLLSKSHLPFSAPDHPRKATEPVETLELMLQEVQGLTWSAAGSIAIRFPSFRHLMEAYEEAESGGAEAGGDMVVGCEVRSLKNGAPSERRVGKALSKKLYHVWRGADPLALT